MNDRSTIRRSGLLTGLTLLIAVAALLAAGVGLFWHNGAEPFEFTTLHGETVEIYGQGLYRHDTFFKAPILRGTDAVTFFLAVPLLLAALFFYRRGSLRGHLMLTGMLGYFLYNAASLALGAAYNELFILYVVYFSASLFAFVLAFSSAPLHEVAGRMSPTLPRRLIAAFLFLAGLSVLVWLIDIIGALAEGQVPPHLAIYHTEVTYVIDLGIIAPAAFLSGILLLRRVPVGYLLTAVLLILNALIGPMVVAQSIFQRLAGVALTTSELIIFAGIFAVTSLIAAGLAAVLLRSIRDER